MGQTVITPRYNVTFLCKSVTGKIEKPDKMGVRGKWRLFYMTLLKIEYVRN